MQLRLTLCAHGETEQLHGIVARAVQQKVVKTQNPFRVFTGPGCCGGAQHLRRAGTLVPVDVNGSPRV